MHEAAQHRRANGQDEEAERTSDEVKDEAVFCALAALLERGKLQHVSTSTTGMDSHRDETI